MRGFLELGGRQVAVATEGRARDPGMERLCAVTVVCHRKLHSEKITTKYIHAHSREHVKGATPEGDG